jgi:hypothetical protein
MEIFALNRSLTAVVLTLGVFVPMVQADDLHFKKNISVGGSPVSSSEVWMKGARERSLSSSPTGNLATIRQCDFKRTVTLNNQAQTYLVASDPQDEAALKAAALMGGSQAATTGGTVTQTTTVIDTGERKQLLGYTARHLKTTVLVESSPNACSQVSQKYEIDGWYADLAKEQASCAQALPPIRQAGNCNDQVIVRRKGTGKPGYPLLETITLHNGEDVTKIHVSTTEFSKQTLGPELFDVPAGYREVKTQADLLGIPQMQRQATAYSGPSADSTTDAYSTPAAQAPVPTNSFASPAPSKFADVAAQFGGQNGMMAQAQQFAQTAAQKPPARDQFDKLQKAMADAQAKAGRPGDNALTCDAIQNEIVSSMRDPAVTAAATKAGAWGAEQQAKLEEASGSSKGAMAAQMAMGLASSLGSMFLPGLGLATGGAQAAIAQTHAARQAAAASSNVQQLEEAMKDMIGILPQLMRGQRLMELAQSRKCDWLAGPPAGTPPSGR